MKTVTKRQKQIFILLLLGVIAVNVKRIFMDFEIDAEYAVAMSYRLAQGDKMFLQMWEPHQTSAFLSAFFIRIYLGLFHTTTGIVLYLNTIGVLLKVAVAGVVYKTLNKQVSKTPLIYGCLFFLAVNPKDIALPEFSNMQLWFSALLFCSLITYFKNQTKKQWLVVSAVLLCLEIISYPTCVIVYVAVLLCMLMYSQRKWLDILWTTLVCAVCGGGYLAYFAARMGVGAFVERISQIMAGDASHEKGMDVRLLEYGREIGSLLLWVMLFGLVAYVLSQGWKKLFVDRFWMIFLGLIFAADIVSIVLIAEDYPYLFIYVVIWLLGFAVQKNCQDTTKQIFRVGMSISLAGVFATAVLTNLSLYSTFGYGILGVAVSLLCLAEYVAQKREQTYLLVCLLPVFLLITIFRGGFITKPMNPEPTSVLDVRGIVKSGPAVGMMSTYMGPYMINTSMEEWQKYIKPDDSLLLVGGEFVHTLGYLYEDTEISIDSTICTPTYSEKLLTYWEENPKKYPTVIAVECWYGDLRVPQDSWIMQWITEEWQPTETIDGAYWRYYIKR